MRVAVRLAILAAATLAGLAAAAEEGPDPAVWGAVERPSPGAAEVLGTHAAGCIAGAAALPLIGEHHVVIKPQQNRNWGHPQTIQVVEDIARAARAAGFGILAVEDLSQPRGGPSTGHASHQAGIDADIRLTPVPEPLDPAWIANPPDLYLADTEGVIDRTLWRPEVIDLLRAAATDPRVERIFVNAAIKRELCHAVAGDRSWLRVVRPYWGHRAHMHVRLHCPADSPACRSSGRPIADGDGCGPELAWWFTEEARPKPGTTPVKRVWPPLPAACEAVYRR